MRNKELGISTDLRKISRGSGVRRAFLIPDSQFIARLAIGLFVSLMPFAASAKLAVFVDGRVLKVDVARLDGS